MEGAHPKILERLLETNKEKTVGYGLDEYTESAKAKIREACASPDARVFFLVGGTQANATVIDSILRNYEGVVSCETGHIAAHECGAIEASGHKVITLPNHEGKMAAADLEALFLAYELDESRDHTVKPGAVYISHPTEYGTLYTKAELSAISRVAKSRGVPLFLDGARLGYGLASYFTDLTLPDIAQLCDVFYIGGTKVGALFGEAVVITNDKLCPHFFSTIKQHGALLAKGRMLGIQFDTLFSDGLYLEISKKAIGSAMYLKDELKKRGFEFFIDSPTNQQFVVIDNDKLEALRKKVGFTVWERLPDNKTVIRFVTSFMTEKDEVEKLLSAIDEV